MERQDWLGTGQDFAMVEKMSYFIIVKDKTIVDGAPSMLHPTEIWIAVKDLFQNFVWDFAEINVDYWPNGIAVGEERVVGGNQPSIKMELFTTNELESIFNDILVWSDTDIRGWNTKIIRDEINWNNWDVKMEVYWDWKVTAKEKIVIDRLACKFKNTVVGHT